MLKECLSKALRFCINWKKTENGPTEDFIAVYVHTSYADCLPIFMNYDSPIFSFSKFIAMPQLFNRFTTPILRYLTFIPSTRLEDKNLGAVQRFADEFRTIKATSNGAPVSFFLSPKGTIQNRPWRTGYFHLAKNLNVPIYAVVLDWIDREVRFHKVINVEDYESITEEEARAKLESYLAFAPPLNPERCEVPLPDIKSDKIHLIWNMLLPFDLCVTSLLFFLPTLIQLYFNGKIIHAALMQTTIICSYLYHIDNERQDTAYGKAVHDLDIFYSIVTFLVFTLTASQVTLYYVFLTTVSFFFYLSACPRGCCKHRGKYALLHPMFHVFAGLASYELARYIN